MGYLYGPEGREPVEKLVYKITKWLTCTNVKDVRAFLGLVGFYRNWIHIYGIITKGLSDLTKKDAVWK